MAESTPSEITRPAIKIVEYGNYFLIEKIATGGMAEIFRAKRRGLEGFEKLVAVKRILSHFSSNEEFISMFIQEAKVAALLTHPNIVQIYDLGKVEDSYYIAMEYVAGKDLRSIIKRCRESNIGFNMEQVVYVISKVCAGLDYAHRKKDLKGQDLNLVHRDVSPQNILISYDGDIKLVDFGIAKAASQSSETRAGVLKGKIAYMSPEQAWGRILDKRSDIFSAGILLYELLTRERLFKGDSDLNTLEMVRVCRIDPPAAINKDIPPELEGVVLRALAEDPGQRYQRAGEMQAELEKFLFTGRYEPGKINLHPVMQQLFEAEIAHEAQIIKEMEELFFASSSYEEKTVVADIPPDIQAMEEKLQKVVTLESTSPSLKTTPPTFEVAPSALPEKAPPSVKRPRVAAPSLKVPPAKSKKPLIGAVVGLALVAGAAFWAYKSFVPSSPAVSREKSKMESAATPAAQSTEAKVPPGGTPLAGLQKAAITVSSTPTGAMIWLNNQKLPSSTPTTLDNLASDKEYVIAVRKDGFNDWTTKVSPKAGERLNISANLAPRLMGTLSVDAKPWAEVLVDGQPKGTTPLAAINLTAGKHRVTLRNPNLQAEESFEVLIESGKTVSRVLNLAKAARAYLNINVRPWADVYIDGKKVGTTPMAEVPVDAGSHSIRLFNPSLNKEQVVKVNLAPNQKQDINISLQ
jgi:serine/threonine protein kinase